MKTTRRPVRSRFWDESAAYLVVDRKVQGLGNFQGDRQGIGDVFGELPRVFHAVDLEGDRVAIDEGLDPIAFRADA